MLSNNPSILDRMKKNERYAEEVIKRLEKEYPNAKIALDVNGN